MQTDTRTSTTQERADLLQTLAKHRGFLCQTVSGLTDEQARLTPTASQLCLGGIIKHVTLVEDGWATFIEEGPRAVGPADESAYERHAAGFRMESATLADLVARYEDVSRRTDELVASLPSLDDAHPLPEAPWFEAGAQLVGPPDVAAHHRGDGPARRARGHHPRDDRRGEDHGLNALPVALCLSRGATGGWPGPGRPAVRPPSRQGLDHPDHVFSPVPLMAGEVHELSHLAEYRALMRGPRHGDAVPAAELDKAFIPEDVHGSEHRVLVHSEDGCDVFDEWKSLARTGLSLGDGTTYFSSDLIVECHRLGTVNLDRDHGTSHSSPVDTKMPGPS